MADPAARPIDIVTKARIECLIGHQTAPLLTLVRDKLKVAMMLHEGCQGCPIEAGGVRDCLERETSFPPPWEGAPKLPHSLRDAAMPTAPTFARATAEAGNDKCVVCAGNVAWVLTPEALLHHIQKVSVASCILVTAIQDGLFDSELELGGREAVVPRGTARGPFRRSPLHR
jgi:hypothetical protein